MRRLNPFLIAFFTSVILCGSCSRAQSTAHDPVERIDVSTIRVYKDALDNLKVAKASMMPFPDQLYLMGKIGVTEDRTNIVPARVAGRIEAISFASGESVHQGQLLATLFSPDFVAAKEEYLQSLKKAKADPGKADVSDFENLTQMSKKKLEAMGLNPKDIDGLANTAPNQPSFLTIRSPRNGVIIAKAAVLGNLVNVGDTLFTIGDLSKVWFLGDLYPEDLQKVKKNQEVIINVPGENQPLHGKVSFISPLVDPTTRSIKIRALIDNSKNILKADMYVQGSVILNQEQALLVPTVSVVRSPEGYFVFKRVSAPTYEQNVGNIDFRKVVVHVGPERQGMTSIMAGLSPGDEIVADGAWLLDAALNSTEKVN